MFAFPDFWWATVLSCLFKQKWSPASTTIIRWYRMRRRLWSLTSWRGVCTLLKSLVQAQATHHPQHSILPVCRRSNPDYSHTLLPGGGMTSWALSDHGKPSFPLKSLLKTEPHWEQLLSLQRLPFSVYLFTLPLSSSSLFSLLFVSPLHRWHALVLRSSQLDGSIFVYISIAL